MAPPPGNFTAPRAPRPEFYRREPPRPYDYRRMDYPHWGRDAPSWGHVPPVRPARSPCGAELSQDL